VIASPATVMALTSRRRTRWLCATAIALAGATASADPMDLSLNRLSYYNSTPWGAGGVNYQPSRWEFRGGCGTAGTAGTDGQAFAQCFPDNQLWANLVNELGAALAPALAAPAMTLGTSGLYVGYELSITNLQRTGEHWRRGTEGSAASNVNTDTATRRDNGDATGLVSRVHVRKGLPFGFELGTQVSHLHDSGMWAIGLDLRWALFEGFHRNLGWLPDLAVRGSVNTLAGQSQMTLTVVGIDAVLSKRFTLGGQVRLSPYVGAQGLFIFGDSGVIDLTPSRSAQTECPRPTTRYVPDTRTGADRSPSGLVGQVICNGGGTSPSPTLPGDLNDTRNSAVFQPMRILRTRGFLGLQLQWEVLMVTAEFSVDLADPTFTTTPPTDAGRPVTTNVSAGAPTRTPVSLDNYTQWTTTVGVGLAFR
jgi:hypothetical protein